MIKSSVDCKRRLALALWEKLRRKSKGLGLEQSWQLWLLVLFPGYVSSFARRHEEWWVWVWSLERGVRPRPMVGIWPRGGGKSTSAELATVAAGARQARNYAWYCSETQEQADRHVETIAAMLESATVERYYPQLSSRQVGKYGNSKGWRRERLRTASGFTVDAIGLDTARRGARVEEMRPDLMIFDDLDGKLDSPAMTKKKMDILTHSMLPAGSPDLAVLMIQNLIIPNGIFGQLADGRAEFLADRIVSGPYPAIEGLTYEQREGRHVITGGQATWDGQDLAVCQSYIDTYGLTAFLNEAQHDVDAPPGGMFDHIEFRHCSWDELPDLIKVEVWVDPAVTSTDQSDSMGIQADGLGGDGVIYRLWSWEQVTSPEDALRRAILKALELKAKSVGVETDQGGDTWRSVYRRVCDQMVEEATQEMTARVLRLWDEVGDSGEVWQRVADELVSEIGFPDAIARVIRKWLEGVVKDDVRSAVSGLGATIKDGVQFPLFKSAKAGEGYGPKTHRAGQMLADYERGKIVHVTGTHTTLERALRRFPLTKPFDLVDASFWSWNELRNKSLTGKLVV